LSALKGDLAGTQSSPLEILVIDLVGVTWLAACQGESAAASPASSGLPVATYKLRRAESTQRRFASAGKTLTLVPALLPRAAPLAPPSQGLHARE